MKRIFQLFYRQKQGATALLCVVLLAFSGFNNPLFPQKVVAVEAVGITVNDLDSEVEFFMKVLDFQKVDEVEMSGKAVTDLYGISGENISVRIATLKLNNEQIRLLDFEGVESRPVPYDTRGNDRWFQHLAIVVSDMKAAYQRLLQNDVMHVSTSPQTLPAYLPNAAGIEAFYFRDPEGHNLELICFPPGKGDPKWHAAAKSGLFLGIDHTAITIADTGKSKTFYQQILHLTHAGHSENYGTEQEHLNQVFGARLDINGFRAEAGFGVEFLRYIAPPGGRPMPPDSSPSDLWHYQTEMITDNFTAMTDHLAKAGFSKISTQAVIENGLQCVLFRDPDGHAVLLRSMPPSKI